MNLVLDQDNNFYLIYLSILITCLLDSGGILLGEVMCESLLGVKINKLIKFIFTKKCFVKIKTAKQITAIGHKNRAKKKKKQQEQP